MKIIMYHYVRDYNKTDYPKIKGIDINNFKNQIKFLHKNYNILNPFEIHVILIIMIMYYQC